MLQRYIDDTPSVEGQPLRLNSAVGQPPMPVMIMLVLILMMGGFSRKRPIVILYSSNRDRIQLSDFLNHGEKMQVTIPQSLNLDHSSIHHYVMVYTKFNIHSGDSRHAVLALLLTTILQYVAALAEVLNCPMIWVIPVSS